MGYLDDVGLTYLIKNLDVRYTSIKLTSKIERIGEYRYLIIELPYSDELMTQINSGNVTLRLFKQSKKKASDSHNPYIKWVTPTTAFGVGSGHFIGSFSDEYTVISGGVTIPPSITLGDTTSSLLTMTYNSSTITLQYNLSELAKAMSFINDTTKTVAPCDFISTNFNQFTDTVVNGTKVIGKRLRNKRVALRYKFRLQCDTTQIYSEFTDVVTILYTRVPEGYLSVGMQIN